MVFVFYSTQLYHILGICAEIDPGYGEPFWDSVESQLAHAIFAIPGVRGIEFGDGFKAAAMKGTSIITGI